MTNLRRRAALNRVLCVPDVFTAEECQRIIDTALSTWREYEGHIGLGKGTDRGDDAALDSDYRHSTVFEAGEPDEWLCGKILSTILEVNAHADGFGFDIVGLAEPPSLMRYEAPSISKDGRAGKYDWHMDLGADANSSTRKISYSIILNPGQYEGGLLNFLVAREPKICCDQKRIGTMIVFPSYVMHCVSEVTEGTRYVLVGWAHGNSFR